MCIASRPPDPRLCRHHEQGRPGGRTDRLAVLQDDGHPADLYAQRRRDPLGGHARSVAPGRHEGASCDDVRSGPGDDRLPPEEDARVRRGRLGLAAVRARHGRPDVHEEARHQITSGAPSFTDTERVVSVTFDAPFESSMPEDVREIFNAVATTGGETSIVTPPDP